MKKIRTPEQAMLDHLHLALSLRRDAGSQTEAQYAQNLFTELSLAYPSRVTFDTYGSIWVDLRMTAEHTTMFTAHTDTVHAGGGMQFVQKTIQVDEKNRRCPVGAEVWSTGGQDVLGADDGAGVALLIGLMSAGVPALYALFRAEECGAAPSQNAGRDAKNKDSHAYALMHNIQRAVAFDRAGYHDVIDTQSGGRCCSPEFADALSSALTRDDMTMVYSPTTGVFTDTANLRGVVPECTNLSVGYFAQHTTAEVQDVSFLKELLKQCISIDWDSLPTVRDPQEVPRYTAPKYPYSYPKSYQSDWLAPYGDDGDIVDAGWGYEYHEPPSLYKEAMDILTVEFGEDMVDAFEQAYIPEDWKYTDMDSAEVYTMLREEMTLYAKEINEMTTVYSARTGIPYQTVRDVLMWDYFAVNDADTMTDEQLRGAIEKAYDNMMED